MKYAIKANYVVEDTSYSGGEWIALNLSVKKCTS